MSLGGGLPLAGRDRARRADGRRQAGGLGGHVRRQSGRLRRGLRSARRRRRRGFQARAARSASGCASGSRRWPAAAPLVGDVRGLGPMLALELSPTPRAARRTDQAAAVVAAARERGLLLLSCGLYGDVIRLLPPLTIEPPSSTRGSASSSRRSSRWPGRGRRSSPAPRRARRRSVVGRPRRCPRRRRGRFERSHIPSSAPASPPTMTMAGRMIAFASSGRPCARDQDVEVEQGHDEITDRLRSGDPGAICREKVPSPKSGWRWKKHTTATRRSASNRTARAQGSLSQVKSVSTGSWSERAKMASTVMRERRLRQDPIRARRCGVHAPEGRGRDPFAPRLKT